MRVSPTAAFVLATLAFAGALGGLAAQTKPAAASDATPRVPGDAASHGFVARQTQAGVVVLEATRPFTLGLANGPVTGAPPPAGALAHVGALVARELDRYPPRFLQKVHLAGIVVATGLVENGVPIPSLPNVAGLLLLDVRASDADLVHVLHHEIFHFFDLAEDGVLFPDPGWQALNPPGFLYGSGGRSLRAAWAGAPTDALPGALSAYATSGVEEDKAETFAFAVVDAPFVAARRAADPAVGAKVGELARRLAVLEPELPRRLGLDRLTSRP